MTLNFHVFMTKMEKRFNFSGEDKAILKSQAEWRKAIAPKMAEHSYDYLGRDA